MRPLGRTDASGAAALRLHNLLARLNYAPSNLIQAETLRVEHARLLLQHGETAAAQARLQTILTPRLIIAIRTDRTFDPLRADPGFDAKYNVEAAVSAAYTRYRWIVSQRPASISDAQSLVAVLRMKGESREALTFLQGVIAIAQSPQANAEFNGLDQVGLNWLLDQEANLFADLGRTSEADAAFQQAVLITTGEGPSNLSQRINFADLLVAEARPQQALDALAGLGPTSPFGAMSAAAVRACAAEELGNQRLRDEMLDFLRQHERDHPRALTSALLCVNDLDGAAASYVRRLADPMERQDALLALQIFQSAPLQSRTHQGVMLQRLGLVRDRADVRQAVNAVGRIERQPVIAADFGDLAD